MGNLEQEMVIQRELESAASRQRAADEEEIHQLRKKLEEVRTISCTVQTMLHPSVISWVIND